MAKGIRVNLLAKTLGVPSKLVLRILKERGFGEKFPNHMTTMSAGLAASVRQWIIDYLGAHEQAVTFGATAQSPETPEPVRTEKPVSATAKAKADTTSIIKKEPMVSQFSSIGKASGRAGAAIELIKTRQHDYEAHLADAKMSDRRLSKGDRQRRNRFVRAAIESQAAVFDGYISLLFDRYIKTNGQQKITKADKIKRLRELATRHSGKSIPSPQFLLLAYRHVSTHPSIQTPHPTSKGSRLTAADINRGMPAPAEVEAEERRINDFLKKLISSLPKF
jgi:hypothetical protein